MPAAAAAGARHGQQQRGFAVIEACQKTCQGACKIGYGIGPDRGAERGVFAQMAVGVDEQLGWGERLLPQALQRVLGQRLILKELKPLVHSAHA